jgi:hypothetical protein
MKALRAIVGQVQGGGKEIASEAIGRARACGATNGEIHDIMLIAPVFCMFRRYVEVIGNRAAR